MRRFPKSTWVLVVFVSITLGMVSVPDHDQHPGMSTLDEGGRDPIGPGTCPPPTALAVPGPLDMRLEPTFTRNLGQEGEGGGLLYASGDDLSVALGDGWISYLLHGGDGDTTSLVRIEFEDIGPCTPTGMGLARTRSSFFLGGDPADWYVAAESYEEAAYIDLWEGIDLRLRFEGGRLKYEFRVAPGADPSDIQLRYRGAEGLSIDPGTGDLVIRTACGAVRDTRPIAFQPFLAADPVPCAFAVSGGHVVSFQVGAYDPERPLVIDPSVAFSTFIGGDGLDVPFGLVVDGKGDVCVLARTYSEDFPVTPGTYQRNYTMDSGFAVFKMDANLSTLKTSAFIGCDGAEVPRGLYLDDEDYIYLVGHCEDPSFPVTDGSYDTTLNGLTDGVIVKMDPNATRLVYSTFIGGSQWDFPFDLAVDGSGNAVVAGTTYSTDFPTTSDAYDDNLQGTDGGFLLELSADGSDLLYSTFIDSTGTDSVEGVRLDPSGEVLLAGYTSGQGFPTTADAIDRSFNGRADGFFMRFNMTGSRVVYSTYFGGSSLDSVGDIFVDRDGSVLIAGTTLSSQFPTTTNAYDDVHNGDGDGYVLRLNASYDKLDYSTYLGGSSDETVHGLSVDVEGRAYVTGDTRSRDYPTTRTAYSKSLGGIRDALVAVLSRDGSDLVYSTYLGGDDGDRGLDISLDSRGFPVVTGETYSDDFPTTPGAYDRSLDSNSDMFISALDMVPPTILAASIPSALTTGDPFQLSLNATDDLAVHEAVLEHWFGDDPIHRNASFSLVGTAGDVTRWSLGLQAPLVSLDELNYVLRVTDSSGNVNDTLAGSIPVLDNDPPLLTFGGPSPDGYGQEFNLTALAVDNIGVGEVTVSYRLGSRQTLENASMDLMPSTSLYGTTITVPAGFLGRFGFHIEARDTSGNVNRTDTFVTAVHDRTPVEFLDDLSDDLPTTGDPFILQVEVRDNIGVQAVHVNLLYGHHGTGTFNNMSLSPHQVEGRGNGTYLLDTYEVPPGVPDYVDLLYFFTALDVSGNWNRTELVSLDVLDDDPPEVVEDLTGALVTTGDPVDVVVRIEDNRDVLSAFLTHNVPGYDLPEVRLDELDVDPRGNGTYGTTLTVPNDWAGPLVYHVEASDHSLNRLVSENVTLEVTDDELPRILSIVTAPDVAVKGHEVRFEARVDDNIDVAQVTLAHWSGNGEPTNETMARDADALPQPPMTYSLVIDVPREVAGPLSYWVHVRDAEGNWNRSDVTTVTVRNIPPTVSPLPSWEVVEGREDRLDLTPYLEDGNDPLSSLRIIVGLDGVTADGLVLVALFDVWSSERDLLIEVTDGEDTVPATIPLRVVNVNDPPVILDIGPRNGSVFHEGEDIFLTGNVSDEDDDDLTFTWMDGGVVLGGGRSLVVDDLPPGMHTIRFLVSDGVETVTGETVVEVEARETGSGTWPYVVVAAVVLAVVAASLLLLRSRRGTGEEAVEEPGKEPEVEVAGEEEVDPLAELEARTERWLKGKEG